MGWYVAFCIIGGILGGLWLDRRLGTGALFTLLGVVLGVVVASYGLYRMVWPMLAGNNSQAKNRGKEHTK
ncbi:MAG: AtpZ/AtpI family protein [Chloroflexi bacterium]|nr:AtpZ/AtpI family protein [Chloroflexota bacterium]